MDTSETQDQNPVISNDVDVWGGSTTTQPLVETTPETVPDAETETKPVTEPEKPVTTETTQPQNPAVPDKVEPVVTEKIVEKIVEKLPEFKDDYSKQLFEAIQAGKENELYDYLSRKNKDYTVMSDLDVVKEKLKLDNPTWTPSDVDLEIKFKYGSTPVKKDLSGLDPELDADAYEKAIAYNESIDQKELLLSREARDARLALEANKKTIEFPKIQTTPVTPETPQLTQQEIDESQKQWEEDVDREMLNLSDFKFKVGDEEVVYKITDEDKATQTAYMKDFSAEKFAADRGWVDKDGNYNIAKLAEDALKLENFEKIVASSATQMKTLAKKDVIADIKNVDLNPSQSSPQVAQDLGAQIWS